jgi:hypothetical protein
VARVGTTSSSLGRQWRGGGLCERRSKWAREGAWWPFYSQGTWRTVRAFTAKGDPASMRWYGGRTPADARGTGGANGWRLKGCGERGFRAASVRARLGEGAGASGRSGEARKRAHGSARVPLDVAFRCRLFRFTLVRLHLSQNFSTKVH